MSKRSHDLPPHPEGSNGCSGGVSWFYRNILHRAPVWEPACDLHDFDYAVGGTKEDRKRADKALRQRLFDAGRPIRAWVFYIAVRLFGARHFNWHDKA